MQQDPVFRNRDRLRTILGDIDVKELHHADRVVVSPGVPLENYGLLSLLQSVSLSCTCLFAQEKGNMAQLNFSCC